MDFDTSLLRAQIAGNQSQLKELKSRFRNVSIITYVLFVLLGVGTWSAINGVFFETPVLSAILPECHRLTTYIVIIVQVANIGPVIYLAIKGCMNMAGRNTEFLDTVAIYCVLSLVLISCVLLSIFWQKQVRFNESNVSISFFLLAACIALSSNASAILFIPFLAAYPGIYLSALFVGEGLSGLVPSLWGLVQGSPTAVNCSYAVYPPEVRFGPSFYFVVLVILAILSITGFSLLHILPAPQNEKSKIEFRQLSDLNLSKGHSRHFTYRPAKKNRRTGWCAFTSSSTTDWHQNSIESCESNHYQLDSLKDASPTLPTQENKTIWLCVFLIVMFIISGLSNSILFAFMPYYTIPYSMDTFYWTINLYFISMTIWSLCGGIFYSKHKSLYPVLTSVYIAIAVWLIFLAKTSPEVPMHGTGFGGFQVVFLSIVAGGIVGYVKVGVAITTRSMGGEFYLLLLGIVTQLGALIGSLIAFIVIIVTRTFHL